MADEIKADLDQMRWLGTQVEAAATTMQEGTADALTIPIAIFGEFGIDAIPSGAFGNTSGAAACRSTWLSIEADAVGAYGNVTSMLQSDVGRLGEVVGCFDQMDLESADEVCASARGLTVYTTHVYSEGSDERGDHHDRERDGQLNEAIDHVVGTTGPVVFTGDLNETRTSHTNSGDTISELATQHGYTDAGVAAGGTSREGNRIDYVFTSPQIGVPGPADRVEGHPSDHDGIAVDITLAPEW